MDEITNPFTPGAGSPPPALVGRDNIIYEANTLIDRTLAGRSAQSILLTGLRGVGKTVLLNKVRHMAIDKQHISIIQLEIEENKTFAELLVPELLKTLYELNMLTGAGVAVKRGLMALRNFIKGIKVNVANISIDLAPLQGVADSGDLNRDLCDLMLTVAAAAKAQQRILLLLIDEMQLMAKDELNALILTMHKAQQIIAPIALVGAGLPTLPMNTGKAKSYAERLFLYPDIGKLNMQEAQDAISEPAERAGASFTKEALETIFNETQGYPYFLQTWAYNIWNTSPHPKITLDDVMRAKPRIQAGLDSSFFRVRYDRLTPREKIFMHAMALCDSQECTLSEVAKQMQSNSSSISRIREQLVRKGMLFSPRHGCIRYTVPLFKEFLLRVQNRS
ncbi:MAG: ATP-binding protein [Akkermansia sp.]|nr:ATP-binding protein [Akkermansia sp.]